MGVPPRAAAPEPPGDPRSTALGQKLFRYGLAQASTLPALVGALLIVVTGSTGGLYLVALGIVLTFALGVTNAWVLLVEILR